jgi:hypothetical protein
MAKWLLTMAKWICHITPATEALSLTPGDRQMADVLSLRTAREYAERFFANDADYSVAKVIWADLNEPEAPPVVNVILNTPLGPLTGCMDVWIECGRLYGEY